MYLKHLEGYINDNSRSELVKIEPKIEVSEETTDFYVTFTKETYHFFDEESADAKISAARTETGFAGCDKKFKPGKVNKAGETTRPDIWQVVIKLNH